MEFQELGKFSEGARLTSVVDHQWTNVGKELELGALELKVIFQAATTGEVEQLLLVELVGKDQQVLDRIIPHFRNNLGEDLAEVTVPVLAHAAPPAYSIHRAAFLRETVFIKLPF
jgi:hypothetical protein